MKRLVPALILSLGIHALIFQLNADFVLNGEATTRRTDTLSIILFEPEAEKPEKTIKRKKRKAKKPTKIRPLPESLKTEPVKTNVKKLESEDFKAAEPDHLKAPGQFENRVIREVNEDDQAVVKAVPMYKRNPPPEYPEAARRRGYQGTVVLNVLVNANGGVSDLKIAESSNYPVLDRSALKSVEKWSFVPGMRGSKKEETWVRVPVSFRLEK